MKGMLFQPTHASLGGSRRCSIRTATLDDAAALLELERAIVRDRHGIVKWESELPRDAAAYGERERPLLEPKDGSALCIVAEEEGRGIVAEATLRRFPFQMIKHVAVLGIGVHPEAQGIGLGRELISRLLDWARAHRDEDGGRIVRVELYVRGDNARAIALYASLGFELEGTRRAFVRRDDGVFVDDRVMALLFDAAGA